MTTGPVLPMRPAMEIQRAHDLLAGIILKECDLGLSGKQFKQLASLAGVLCWVLRHDHNKDFEVLISEIEAMTKLAGYTFDKQT